MLKHFALSMVLIFAVVGCSNEKVSPDAVGLTIDFSWKETKDCTDISPELHIQGIPDGTMFIDVDMWDLTNRYHHGGGKVTYDGTGVIARGALREYRGPCPSLGSPRYEFTVKALDAKGVVIGKGIKMKRFPPEDE